MKKRLKIIALVAILSLMGNIVLADDNGDGEQDKYDITLSQNYNYGEQKVNLEWTGVTDDTKLIDVAQIGDYVDYPISESKLNSNFNRLDRNIQYNTELKIDGNKWKVLYNDGETIKLISADTVATTRISGEDYGWRKANPYSYGDEWGDCGGYGVYYQIDQIAKCFANYNYASNVRSVDIATLARSNGLTNLRNFLGQTEADSIEVEERQEGYNEIYDTDKHDDWLGMGGYRIYDAKVGTITDQTGFYTGGSRYFIPNYYNGTDFLRAVYYVDGNGIYLHRVYTKGKQITAGVKIVITLRNGLYKTSGDGSPENPWTISTIPGFAKYTVYQKQEGGEYEQKSTVSNPSIELNQTDAILDLAVPDKPTAELGLIRGDGWNLNLTVNSGDNGTYYYHKITAKAGKSEKLYTSNETCTTVVTGVAGYSYTIDKNSDTNPGSQIMSRVGQKIKIPRTKVNTGDYLHIKAIDYAGNESETLHMKLTFVFRDLNLYKQYQEASNFDDNGIAQTPGWNYVNIDWTPIEITEDRSELPEVILTIDTSGSMNRNGSGHWNESNPNNRINLVKSGATALVTKLLEYYPDMKIGIVTFASGVTVRANPTNDLNTLKNAISGLYAVGSTNAAGGISKSTDMLVNSTQKNRVLIAMTDGYPDSASATINAIKRATNNNINVISLLIDAYSEANSIYVPYSNKSYWVNNSTSELYNTLAYEMYQAIVDTMISRYDVYRDQEGINKYQKVLGETTEVNYADSGATDRAGPTRPIVTLSETADRDGKIKMSVWAEDRGTSYEFYAKFVHPRTKEELYSNPTVQEVKTGVAGYAWSVTDSRDSDPGSTIRDLQFVFGKNEVGKWLHIRAIDHAGNLGEVCHIKIETSRFIPWEELNETEELFCVQHGQTIPAREDGKHLNAVLAAGSGAYAIREVIADPKTGDRVGTRFVEGTTTNIYGTQPIYSYSLGKYEISPDTPSRKPGKEGNATDQEAYILNHYKENNTLESAVQKAMYHTEISKGNVTWNWEETEESSKLLAEANAYASYKRKGYEFSNIKLDTAVYMDNDYKDVLIGPFILKYDPQGVKVADKEVYFAGITGMKIYNQNDEVISELDKNANNIGSIDAEFVYTGTATANKRLEELFTKEKYKYPVGYEEFYIKIKYNKKLEDVTQINKIEFIHSQYEVDAQYNVLDGTYNKVKWTPNRITKVDKDVLWCNEVETNGYNKCIHDKTYSHIVGCYFYLTATVYNSYRTTSQRLIDVLWVKNGYNTKVQTLYPGTGEEDPEYPSKSDEEKINDNWRLVMTFDGNVWDDGMEDKNNGLKENSESGIEKAEVNIYQIDQNKKRTGISYNTYTDTVGNYTLKDVKKGIYEIEFVYNGQIYKSTKLLVNGNVVDYKNDLSLSKYKNNSVAEETATDRQELNTAYTEIAGNDTAIGGRGEIGLSYLEEINASYIQTTDNGYTKPEFAISARTSSNDVYYPISKRITVDTKNYIRIVDTEYINLGLSERYKTDSSLRTDLYQTTFSIKGDKQSYIYSEKNIRDINSNTEVDEYVQEVNRADYNWKLEDVLSKAPDEETKNRLMEILGSKENSELEAYLDYIIVIRNAGEKDQVQIAELANYFSKDLEYSEKYRDFDITSWAQVKYDTVNEETSRNKTDKIEIKWSANSKYGGINNPYSNEYNKIYTTGLDREDLRVQKGEYLEVHIILKVTKNSEGKIELDENNASKADMAEINGYKTYYISDGSIAGLIDRDSKPGNGNPTEEKEYREDDEDKAPDLKMKLSESSNSGDSTDGQDNIKKDDDGNIRGYGNVLEGNVWEDLKTTKNIQKLANNQIISDGIRQDDEPLIQNVQVDLVEYFKHPTDSSKDVYLTLKTQKTRAVLSLSNGQKLDGGYSFINLASGNYKIRFTYGTEEQLLQDADLKYNGQDYQGISTEDIYNKEGTETTYEDVEIMLVADVSGSMNGSIDNIKNLANKVQEGIASKLPKIKIGLTKFSNEAELILRPTNNTNKLKREIEKLNAKGETAIAYGLDNALNSYSSEAKKKIMLVLTDSEETVQNVEQVIKKVEEVTDSNKINLITVLTKENDDIFGTESEPRRGTVYLNYNVDENAIIEKVSNLVKEESQLENKKSSSKDLEGNEKTPGTRVYSINKYKLMTLEKAEKIDVENIKKLSGTEREERIKTLAKETYMQAESKMAKYKANNVKKSNIHEYNLALMERPKTKLTIEAEITAIKVVLSDNTTLIDTSKGMSKNVMGLDVQNAPVSIYMDEEIMQGSTLIVDYKVKVRNEGEIDTLANYITGASTDTVTTSAKLVFNYTSRNMLYRNSDISWDEVTIKDIQGMITDEAKKVLKEEDMKTYQTEGLGIELYPLGSKEVEEKKGSAEVDVIITLSKIIAAENNEADLTFDSSMEIVERENTAGHRSETEIPGNYVPDTTPIELDAIKNRKIIISKPLGENKSTTYVLIAIATGIVVIIGVVLIQRKKK